MIFLFKTLSSVDRILLQTGLNVNNYVIIEENEYFQHLSRRADSNGIVILMSTDYAFINMTLNQYYTSFKKLGINNFLYVTSDEQSSEILKKYNIAHYTFQGDVDVDTNKMSNFGTASFAKKTHIKTKIVLKALMSGFTVLMVDVDVTFLQNPLPFFSECSDCDIQMQNDGGVGNSGFYLVRPTKAAIDLHSAALSMATTSPNITNQKALGKILRRMLRHGQIKSKILSSKLFPNGRAYFEKGKRMFAGDNPCRTCVIVHNNYIVSGEAKIYRYKESMLWFLDVDGYYSDRQAKYLLYDNPYDFGEATTQIELNALKVAFAIGHLLNRIVILPAFHCYGCSLELCIAHTNKAVGQAHCSLNTHVRIATLDRYFFNAYREHVFLHHPYVPQNILLSQSPTILIKTDLIRITHQFRPMKSSSGASYSELSKWLDPFSHFHIIRFHSLYNALVTTDTRFSDPKFESRLREGIKGAGYRQF